MAGHKNWRKSGGKSLFKDEKTINKIKSVKSEQNLAVKKKKLYKRNQSTKMQCVFILAKEKV